MTDVMVNERCPVHVNHFNTVRVIDAIAHVPAMVAYVMAMLSATKYHESVFSIAKVHEVTVFVLQWSECGLNHTPPTN